MAAISKEIDANLREYLAEYETCPEILPHEDPNGNKVQVTDQRYTRHRP